MSDYGFTGTRRGMTGPQKITYEEVILRDAPGILRQGCCIGADTDAAVIYKQAMNSLRTSYKIIGHPSVSLSGDRSCRSEEALNLCCTLMPEKTPLARNRNIVNMTHVLVATPLQLEMMPQGMGGGTWYTIQYALKCMHTVIIIWPDGRLEQL